MRAIIIPVALFFILLVTRAVYADPKAITVLEKLPEGYAIYAHADTYEHLVQRTKPVMTFTYGNYDDMLIWTAKQPDGTRTFTLATARLYAPRNETDSWTILADPSGGFEGPDNLLPRTTIAVTKAVSRKPYDATPWATVLSMDPNKGTLYQISYYFQIDGCGAQDGAPLVMHGPQHGWRFVANVSGNYADDAQVIRTTIDVKWTSDPEKPVDLTVTSSNSPEGNMYARNSVRRYTEDFYDGSLPLYYPHNSSNYLLVAPGNTFNNLTSRLIDQSGVSPATDRAAAIRTLRKAILKLNPQLDVEHLTPQEKILIPDESQPDAVPLPSRTK